MLPTQPFFTNKGGSMFKVSFDYSAFTTGLRTAGALLIGNSFLILTNILGGGTDNAHLMGYAIFASGVTMLTIFSFKRG
jgi:hypothetical protein